MFPGYEILVPDLYITPAWPWVWAGMLYIKEDYDLVEAMLREQVEEGDGGDEMMLEYNKTKVMIDMMDRIIAIMVGFFCQFFITFIDRQGASHGELNQPSPQFPSVSQGLWPYRGA